MRLLAISRRCHNRPMGGACELIASLFNRVKLFCSHSSLICVVITMKCRRRLYGGCLHFSVIVEVVAKYS